MKIAGEWWKSDTEAVINQAQKSGQAPNVSDAHTINGNPGPIPNCLANGLLFFRVSSLSFSLQQMVYLVTNYICG